MSASIDPENGDIIENPDPEADSEILDFTNATEDEFHLNNNAEDEFQLNITTAESSPENVDGHLDSTEPECEINLHEDIDKKDEIDIDHESINCVELKEKTPDDVNTDTCQTESSVSGIKLIERKNDEEELVEVEADICDSFEAPEAELGHDVPEAELCQETASADTEAPEAELCQETTPADTEAESCQVLSESCQVEDKCILEEEVVETVEQRESNLTEEVSNDAERCSPIGSPHLLKLTKSESVESYEPECDQESVSLNQDVFTCNKTSDSTISVSADITESSVRTSNIEEGSENSINCDNTESTMNIDTCNNAETPENNYSNDVESSEHTNTCSNNLENPKNKNDDEYDSSLEKTCVQDERDIKSSQNNGNEVTNMQTSCEDCGNSVVKGDHGNKDIITNGNDNLTCESENLNPIGGCEENNVKESSHRKEVLNAGRDFHNDDSGTPISDDDLLSELDSELGMDVICDSTNKSIVAQSDQVSVTTMVHDELSKLTQNKEASNASSEDVLISQDDMSEETWKVIQDLQHKLSVSRQQLQRQEKHLHRSKIDYSDLHKQLDTVIEERDNYQKEIEIIKRHNSDDFYLPQIKELEYTISQQQQEIRGLRDKLSSHDTAAKRAINGLQTEMKLRIDQINKAYKEAVAEKDNMVIKYAQAEKNNLGSLKNIERLESRLKDAAKEKDGHLGKIKDLKIEKARLGHELDLKSSEAHTAKKDAEKLKEQVSSSDVRIKWAQNKLRAELEGHKDTKVNLEKVTQRLKEAKEETEQIRRNCQEIIKTYQESEEIKSNSLDQQLKKKETELLLHQTENKDKEEIYTATMKELEQLKIKHRETLAELHTYQDKTLCLEEEHKTDEDTLNKFKHMLQKQKTDNKDLHDKLEQMVQLQGDFKRAQRTIKILDAEVSELKISNKDLVIEIEACRKRETEKLELTEKLSAKNAELQSENSLLNDKVMALSVEVQNLKIDLQSTESNLEEITKKLSVDTRRSKNEIDQLEDKLKEKSKKVDELSTKIDDEKDEIKTLKRKHVNSLKDLTRQLQQARRKLEAFEANGEKDSTSLGSRTSSTGSLNTLTNGDGPNHSVQQVPSHTYRQASPPEQEYPVITEQVEPDKQMLIERIVKLQRMLARRNEKIEFMDDHAHQLIDDLQKKNKIIQMYALREESGMLTAEAADASKQHQRPLTKAQIAKKHSIMGSVYSSHQTDGTMTIDLSLEINRKLQAVLEDTLIKNMTLKESLDTLGEEIARLSQDNRKMQIQLEKQKR